MSICWYCYWGWAKPVVDIYTKAYQSIGEYPLRYGPSHIVWEDENFEIENIQWCLDRMDDENFSTEELSVIKISLEELLAVPEDIRCCCPKNYDGENPVKYPPRIPVVRKP